MIIWFITLKKQQPTTMSHYHFIFFRKNVVLVEYSGHNHLHWQSEFIIIVSWYHCLIIEQIHTRLISSIICFYFLLFKCILFHFHCQVPIWSFSLNHHLKSFMSRLLFILMDDYVIGGKTRRSWWDW